MLAPLSLCAVIVTPASPPPRLLVTIPATLPVTGAHVTAMFTVSTALILASVYVLSDGALQLLGTALTRTVPTPIGTSCTAYAPAAVVVAVGSALSPAGVIALALVLVHETGHRLAQVRRLRWSYVQLESATRHW